MQYIKRIDGLRGISVLAVVMFHLNVMLFKGGFIGVDIFFVISGFLITGIIQNPLQKSQFNIFSFYLRRIKRLLPPLYAMLFAIAGLSLFFFLPHEIKDIYQGIVATTVYLSNVFNYTEIDYFNTFYAKSPLLHTWSLSVEEQFYFVYPIILILLRNVTAKTRLVILLTLVVFSFAASVYYYRIDPLYTFYYPWFRGWELGLGGITFLYVSNPAILGNIFFQNSKWIYYISIIVILLSIVFCRSDSYIPNFGALPAVLSTCLILGSDVSGKQRTDPLKNRFLVFTGLISYSLYLWHQPILSIVYTFDESLNIISKFAIITLSFLMAYLSWRWIEKPLRYSKTKASHIWIGTIILSISLVSLGMYGHLSEGFMNYFIHRMPPKHKTWLVQRDNVFAKRDSLWKTILKKNEARHPNELKNLDYLIIGDSKGEDMLTTFELNDSIRTKYNFYYLRIDDEDMDAFNDAILKNSDEGLSGEDNRRRFEILSNVMNNIQIKNIILSCTWQDKSNLGVTRLVKTLSSQASKLYLVSTAQWNDVTSLSFKLAKSDMTDKEIRSYLYNNILDDWKRQSDNLHSLTNNLFNVVWVYKENAFCNTNTKECSLFNKNKAAYIYDSGHFTVEGAYYFGTFIWENRWFDMAHQ